MKKQDLATALGVSPSMVSRLARRGMPTDDVERAKRWRKRHLETGRTKGVRYDPKAMDAMQKQHETLMAQALAEAKRSAGPSLRDALSCLNEALAGLPEPGTIPKEATDTLFRLFFAAVVARFGGLDAARLHWWDWCSLLPEDAAEDEALADLLERTCTEPMTLADFHQAMQPACPLPLDALKAAFLAFR